MDNSTIDLPNNNRNIVRKFFLGAGVIAVTNVALQLKGIILIPLISKKFGAIGYGAWTQVTVLVAMVGPLLALGIENGYYRYMASASKSDQVHALCNSVLFKTITCGIGAFLIWMLSSSISSFWFGGLEEASLVTLCGLVIYSNLIVNDAKSFFRIRQQAGGFSIFTLIQGFGNIGVVILVFILGGGIFEIVAAGAGLDLLFSLLVVIFLGFKYGFGRYDFNQIRKFISYGAVLIPTAYAMWVLNFSDRLFLAHYRTLGDIGIYSVAYNLGYVMIILFYAPIWILYPPAATKAWEEGNIVQIQDLFQKSAKLALGLSIPGIVGIALIGKPLILHLSKSEFLPGAPLMPLIALGYLFLMVGSFWSVNLSLGMKQKISGFSSIGAALLNILLNWLLIPTWGIIGAALSTLFAFSLQFGIDFWFGRKILTLPIPLDFIKKSLISSAGMSVVGLLGVSWAMESKLNLILLVISCSAVYFISLYCLKAFHLGELGFIKEA